MGLDDYKRKRDFTRTTEPSGAPQAAPAAPTERGRRFVVQRHRARRLHYDFRLEIGGVLVSWAVPKGITLDPAARHLAVHVEDHPIEYLDFEGVIPAGEYGAGDVIVWDRGTWEPHHADDPAAAVAAGEIHVDLHGEKLSGRVVLVRTSRGDDGRDDWLVLHKRDGHAVAGWDPEEHPLSVLSGRTNDEVAADPERIWTSAGEQILHEPVTVVTAPTADELAALAALGAGGTWTLQGRDIALTNLDKVLIPGTATEAPATKRDLVAYYAGVAPVLVPHLAGRPLNLRRFPDGVAAKGFWQKAAPAYAPEWICRWTNPQAEGDETREYLVADSAPALAWLANHAAVELHPWTSRTTDSTRPTYALFDIDPGPETTWDEVVVLARLHRSALEHMSLRGYPKVTGSRGIQIWVPIVTGPSFADTRRWVEGVSRAIGAVAGDLVSWAWDKSERHGRARLDYTQNARNKTLVAPYSVRGAPGAPVSAPITWDELDDPGLRPDRWSIRTLPERVAEVGDLMAEMIVRPQVLPHLE